jgi:hypothetical protein
MVVPCVKLCLLKKLTYWSSAAPLPVSRARGASCAEMASVVVVFFVGGGGGVG